MAKKNAQLAPSDTHRAFLESICETPADDAPRLVFADWLEDNGDPEWAEFIRTQIRLADLDEYDYERGGLLFREMQLLRAHGRRWTAQARKFTARVEFSRGFVGEVALPVAKFLDGADALFSSVPVTTLRPLQTKTRWDEFVASPHLGRLRSLDLHFAQLGMARTVALANCPHLANLEELNLGIGKPRPGGLSALLRSPHLRRLRKLDLNNNEFDAAACAVLAKAGDCFPALRALNLGNNGIGPEGARHLAEAGWLGQLESLDLKACQLGDEGLRRLADSGIWANLRRLDVESLGVSPEGCRAVTDCPHLGRVTHLHLPSWGTPVGLLRDLARSSRLSSLRTLDLRNARVADGEVEDLLDSALAPRLRHLGLSGLSDRALARLLASPALSGLVSLDLSGHDGLHGRGGGPLLGRLLREATHLKNLDRLDVGYCQFDDAALADLAASEHLGSVGVLNVRSGVVSAAGYEPFILAPHFTRLRKLTVADYYTLRGALREGLVERFGKDVIQS